MAGPLTIWVTRDEPPDGPLCRALRDAGLHPLLEPVLTRRLIADIRPLLDQLAPHDWLVLTSPFAIESIPAGAIRCRLAVVGESSRALAASRGLRVDLVSPDSTGATLWKHLREEAARGRRILYPRSDQAQPPALLEGLPIYSPVMYETTPRAFNPVIAQQAAIVTVASPSAAHALAQVAHLPPAASIGPTTSSALRALGIEPWLEAQQQTFTALARDIAAAAATLSSA